MYLCLNRQYEVSYTWEISTQKVETIQKVGTFPLFPISVFPVLSFQILTRDCLHDSEYEIISIEN